MWSNNVPLPTPGRLALIILSRVGCRQYEHVAREGGHYYPAIISQITETHNTAHNYIRPDTIISTPICFTGSQLRIFSFCLVLIHLALDWVWKLFACSWYNWPMKHGWVDTPSSREQRVPQRLWQLQISAGSAPCNQAPGGPSEVHSVPAPDTIGTNQQHTTSFNTQ